MNDKQFIETYCQNCGTQRCGGIGTEWFEGCKYKWNHDSYDAASEIERLNNKIMTMAREKIGQSECQKIVEGGTYLEHYNEGSVNARYKAIVECIAAWENANQPTTVEGIPDHCTKCKSIDHCIDYVMNYPNGMIRCPCYGSLKLCVERDKENAED